MVPYLWALGWPINREAPRAFLGLELLSICENGAVGLRLAG